MGARNQAMDGDYDHIGTFIINGESTGAGIKPASVRKKKERRGVEFGSFPLEPHFTIHRKVLSFTLDISY